PEPSPPGGVRLGSSEDGQPASSKINQALRIERAGEARFVLATAGVNSRGYRAFGGDRVANRN
ncbi:MAG TPA: hypothetical protein VLT45_20815, partial [Kofleriaceae bacterium]|nr:hypothetical protein [Kofleriaceae bacterium]